MAQYQSQLWKIAKNPEIPADACWEELESWLEIYGVDVKSQTPDDWMKAIEQIRRKVESIKNSASATRSCSAESDRQHDADSGYGASDKVSCCDLRGPPTLLPAD